MKLAEDWDLQAACKRMPLDQAYALFFPETGVYPTKAKAICRECPVIDECRAANPDPGRFGVFWGTTPEERRRLHARAC